MGLGIAKSRKMDILPSFEYRIQDIGVHERGDALSLCKRYSCRHRTGLGVWDDDPGDPDAPPELGDGDGLGAVPKSVFLLLTQYLVLQSICLTVRSLFLGEA